MTPEPDGYGALGLLCDIGHAQPRMLDGLDHRPRHCGVVPVLKREDEQHRIADELQDLAASPLSFLADHLEDLVHDGDDLRADRLREGGEAAHVTEHDAGPDFLTGSPLDPSIQHLRARALAHVAHGDLCGLRGPVAGVARHTQQSAEGLEALAKIVGKGMRGGQTHHKGR